jgi:hypothetical protein
MSALHARLAKLTRNAVRARLRGAIREALDLESAVQALLANITQRVEERFTGWRARQIGEACPTCELPGVSMALDIERQEWRCSCCRAAERRAAEDERREAEALVLEIEERVGLS